MLVVEIHVLTGDMARYQSKDMYSREEKDKNEQPIRSWQSDKLYRAAAAKRDVVKSEQNSAYIERTSLPFSFQLVYGVTFVIVNFIGPRSRSCNLLRGRRSFALAAAVVVGYIACQSFGPCLYRPWWR